MIMQVLAYLPAAFTIEIGKHHRSNPTFLPAFQQIPLRRNPTSTVTRNYHHHHHHQHSARSLFRLQSTSAKRSASDVELDTSDFSSRGGWDAFYQQTATDIDIDDDEDSSATSKLLAGSEDSSTRGHGSFEFEWHSSISHDSIISEIQQRQQCPDPDPDPLKVLLVGTGNSRLPRDLYEAHNGETTVVCMDYSQPCVDMLKQMHPTSDFPNMHFVCGDVMELSHIVGVGKTGLEQDEIHTQQSQSQSQSQSKNQQYFDYVVDKGLMDALMCDEGCNLEKYLGEVRRILKPNGGKMILISYKLTSSMMKFLSAGNEDENENEKNKGSNNETDVSFHNGLQWNLDIETKSNARVSFSVGESI